MGNIYTIREYNHKNYIYLQNPDEGPNHTMISLDILKATSVTPAHIAIITNHFQNGCTIDQDNLSHTARNVYPKQTE